ncbi:MAG: GNAT family N-acetyltransferase [Rhodovulum sp.]
MGSPPPAGRSGFLRRACRNGTDRSHFADAHKGPAPSKRQQAYRCRRRDDDALFYGLHHPCGRHRGSLLAAPFTVSEGAEEGALIGALARRLLSDTPTEDLRVFTAWEGSTLVGGIFFTRLTFAGDARAAFLMAPVAVAIHRQGKGIGQRLIAHGLDALRQNAVDIAVTYGDPNFYGRVGFAPVSEAALPAPQPLQQPQGWIAQSLTKAPLTPLRGPSRCVASFEDPVLW